jgi:type 1 glutamine amidotransferase
MRLVIRTASATVQEGGDMRAIGGLRTFAGAALLALCAAACGASKPSPGHAALDIDCPLRSAPYSISSPLYDLLLKEDAVATIEHASPGFSARLPSQFLARQTPSFATILSLEQIASIAVPGADLAQLDAALRVLPVTVIDRIARCARYDRDQPDLQFPSSGMRVLVFEKMTGFRDGPSVDAARAALEAMASRKGWTLRTSDRGGAISDQVLANVDVVIWNNVSGDVLTLAQRDAFRRFIERGGGYVGIHGSGGDPVYFWDWYADTLIGARFIGHPMEPQFQDARVVVSGDGPIGRRLAPGWTMNDEWYSFAANPRKTGATIVASLDESTYTPGRSGDKDLRMGDHPVVWARCVGKGRSFYSAIGHRPETYSDSRHLELLEEGIAWAAGSGPSECSADAAAR